MYDDPGRSRRATPEGVQALWGVWRNRLRWDGTGPGEHASPREWFRSLDAAAQWAILDGFVRTESTLEG